MNAVEFLGKEKINSLISQGFSPMQIRDFAKNEYYKPNPNLAQPNLRNDTQTSSDNQQFYQAPSAPSLENRVIQSDKSLADKAIDSLKGLKKEAGAFVENLRTGGDAFRSKDDLMKTQVARINNNGGLIQTLTRSDDESAENLRKNKADLDNIAKSHGYDLGALIDDDGKIYFGKRSENGEIIEKEVTPSFFDDMGTYRNEFLGSLVGGIATGGAGFLPMLGTSAVGASLGGGVDYKNRADLTAENETAGDYLKRMAWAGADDLAGGLAIGGLIKGGKALINHAPSLKNAVSGVGKTAEKVYDTLPISSVVRQFGTDNIVGAERKAYQNLGGETEYLTSLNKAKQSLGDEAFNTFANERVFEIPQTNFESVNKAVDFLNDKLVRPFNETVKKVVAQSDLNEQEANLFLANLAHNDGAKIITDSVTHDPQAYGKAVRTFKKLNESSANDINELLKDTPSVVKVFKEYEKRTKNDYGAVMDTLNEFFSANPQQTSEIIKGNKRRILKNARKLFPDDTTFDKFTATLNKPTNLNEWQELRSIIGDEIGAIQKTAKRNGLNTQDRNALRLLNETKNSIDNAIGDIFDTFEKTNPNLGARAKELMDTARSDYRAFKELEQSELYHQISQGLKDENKMIDTLLKGLDNENGLDLESFLNALGNKDRALIENGIIKSVIANNTTENITDFKAIVNMLNHLPIQSEQARGILAHLNDNAPILNNTSEILKTLKNANPKGYELSQGISHNITSRIKTMIANRLTNKLKSKAPFGFGDDQALKNHINNAIKGSGNLEIALKNLSEIPTENMPSASRQVLKEFIDDFRDLIPKLRVELNGGVKTAENSANLGQNIAKNSDEVVKNSAKFGDEVDILQMAKNKPLKGDNFIIENPNLTKPQTDYNVKISANQRTMEHLGIDTDTLFADLDTLLGKHPELGKPSTIYKIIKAVQDEPNRYFKNNRPDIELIAKDLQDGSLGKMGIINQGENIGKVGHLSVTSQKKAQKEIERLQKRNKDNSVAEAPHSTLRKNGQTAGANSTFTELLDDIIPQNTKQAVENLAENVKLTKKKEQLAKLEKELQETRAKNQKIALPPNQSNNSKRTQIRNLSNKARNLEYKINELQKEITLLNPKSTSREKLLAEYGETYQNGIKKMFSDLQDGTKKYPLEKDLQKGTLEYQNIQKMREWNTRYYDITPNPNFGTNYAEFYHDGIGAFNKIKAEKSGQVSGAFHRKDLGDIDLVWGAIKDENGKVVGYGLSKIITKHKEITDEILDEIIANGKTEIKDGRYSIVLNKDDKVFRVELKSQFDGKPTNNKFVITAYEVESKGGGKYPHTSTLASSDSPATTLKSDDIIPQFDKFKNKKGVEVIDDNEVIRIHAKTQTGDIQEFLYFKDNGKFYNRTLDQYKKRILHSGDFEIKSIDDLEKAVNKSLGENSENVNLQKEILNDTKTTAKTDTLADELANAKDYNAKFEIIKREINKKADELGEQIKNERERIKNKDFYEFEINGIEHEAREFYKKAYGRENISKDEIIDYLAKQKRKELEPLIKHFNAYKKDLNTMEWDLRFKNKERNNIGNEQRFDKYLERYEKRLIKEIDEAKKEANLTYDLNTARGEKAVKDLFYKNPHDSEQAELFERVLQTAKNLNV